MAKAKYDKSSIESILNYARKLTGKSLAEVVDLPENVENLKNRGRLGSLIEKYYFEHIPPNTHEPDFAEAGLELKVTGVLKNKSGKFVAKERLVLTMIDFLEIENEIWEKSTFYSKCKRMLIMFYLFSKDIPSVHQKFVLEPLLYEIPEGDISIIKRDWEFIKSKVKQGKAHELSEGDTFYLGACRKGTGGEREALRIQPKSEIKAKARAFSFKQSYLNSLINPSNSVENTLVAPKEIDFYEAILNKFEGYIGESTTEICKKIQLKMNSKPSKAFRRNLALKILSLEGKEIWNLKKAGIEMKTVVLGKSGFPKEHMSFPGFTFMEVINQEWEDSSFFEKLESKFLLIIFQVGQDGVERLLKVGYWNMPFSDREQAKQVFEETKKRVRANAKNLPRSTENPVAHVRPKGRDGKDKIITPQGLMQLRQCFWLNNKYIGKVAQSL